VTSDIPILKTTPSFVVGSLIHFPPLASRFFIDRLV
jgi:hypothetical protein